MRGIRDRAILGAVITSLFIFANGLNASIAATPDEIDSTLEEMERVFDEMDRLQGEAVQEQNQAVFGIAQNEPTRGDLDEWFPDDKKNQPIKVGRGGFIGGGLIGSSQKGSSLLIAMIVLKQTLEYFGVVHYIGREGSKIEFQVIESKKDFFRNIDRTSVYFALKEFSRYLTAHMCNNPTPENYYKAFAQVPIEEIGFRFKYDMAWALLGNRLPSEPNSVFELGKKWKALGSVLGGAKTLYKGENVEGDELKSWGIVMNDIVGIVTQLNKLMCLVDIRPKPRQELIKRVVIKTLLKAERDFIAENEEIKALYMQLEEEQEQEQMESS